MERFLACPKGTRSLASLCFLLLLLARPSFSSEDAELLRLTQEELESEINTSVDSLIQQSRALTEKLLLATSRLENASNEAEALKAERNDLSISLNDTSRLLGEYRTRTIRLSQSLGAWKKACMTLVAILLALILATAAVLYLELTKKTDFI